MISFLVAAALFVYFLIGAWLTHFSVIPGVIADKLRNWEHEVEYDHHRWWFLKQARIEARHQWWLLPIWWVPILIAYLPRRPRSLVEKTWESKLTTKKLEEENERMKEEQGF